MSQECERKHLRAPSDSGGTLIDPPLDLAGELLARNRAKAADYDCDLGGRSLQQLASEARGELLSAAYEYTRAYRDVPAPRIAPETPLLVAGHQPQLFHPGVWFKNFVLSKLASQQGGVAVNLAIDSDTIKTASIRVPTGSASHPHIESVPFDSQASEIPYEERLILDRDCLKSAGARAAATLSPLVANPLIREFWPLVVERARHGDHLGETIAQARHVQEGLWGATTLELPQSQVCGLPAFHWFTSHLLAHLPRLWEQYNRSVADYRQANRVRSTAHPVPDLAADDGWLEAPFWIWTKTEPRRRRLFVKQRGDEIVLSNRAGLEQALSLAPEGDSERAVDQLAQLASQGVRLRTRALITTLFARLCLGDIFLHGIGGAKYDQVTDLLIERFFGVRPPCYMTLTATLRLPIARPDVSPNDARLLDQQIRNLDYHPERFVGERPSGEAQTLVQQKRGWIDTQATIENAKQRCRAIRQTNDALQPFVADARQRLLAEREQLTQVLGAQTLLASREYAFCLYPTDALQALMDL